MNRAARRRTARQPLVLPDGTKLGRRRLNKTGYTSGANPDPGHLPPVQDPGPAGAGSPRPQDTPEWAEKTRQLVASIPERLRETPEAQLVVSRCQATWLAPVPAETVARWQQAWTDFVNSQPEARAASAVKAGLYVPGADDGTPQIGLWTPGRR